ncbi:MAG: potassium transporter TrkG [Candidatus Bathyarchaeia archaeon]
MQRRIGSNLGFLLQIAGLLTIFPIAVGLSLGETDAVISLFIACVAFLGAGFMLNALCERKDLDFRAASVLFVVAFIVMPLIGALPYFYSDPFSSPNVIDRFTNGYFESISGFTTTGFSFIAEPETLPRSILIYRSLTEVMGGVGIVFLLLAFFQSKRALSYLGVAVGVEEVDKNLKKTYFSVFAIYGIYILAFTAIFYLLGFQNLITTGTFVVDTLTGGYSPTAQQLQLYLGVAPQLCIIALMFLGSLNFAFVYQIITRKFKSIVNQEAILFFIIIAFGTIVFSAVANTTALESLFHVVSMSASVGYSYIPLMSLNSTAISIILVLMIIGGCAFSMAGGIRVSRIIAFFKLAGENIQNIFVKENASKPKKTNGDQYTEYCSAAISIVLFIATLVIFAVIFTTIGVSFTDALIEVGSALTTNGYSMGATTLTMGVGYKWLMIAAMTIGRVEILSILIALFSLRREKRSSA